MTMSVEAPWVKGCLIQIMMLISINVPTMSFGLAMGWVSLASGAGAGAGADDGALVGAAAATFAAGLLGVPLGERLLRRGRRPALFAISAAFAVCWSLKLSCSRGWRLVAARAAAGAAGAGAWALAPLYARETCRPQLHGAGAAAPVVAHNLGVLLALLAADGGLAPPTVEAWCLALSAAHCAACWLAPESPAFLAARGDRQAAALALARLRGTPAEHPALRDELRALPPVDREDLPFYRLAKDMLRDGRRRRAFCVALVCVVGQESCGLLSLLQFAERVFLLAGEGAGGGAARRAVLLGVVQLLASGAALYLVERVGRRPLFVWGALGTGAALAVAAGTVGGAGGAGGAVVGVSALAAAVAADSLALHPAPYAVLVDMFAYQYRGCAVLLATAAASAGGAADTLLFPLAARAAGLRAALALAAAATLSLALFALFFLPETRGRDPEQIYDIICPGKRGAGVDPASTTGCGACRIDAGGPGSGDEGGADVGQPTAAGCDNAAYAVSCDNEIEIDRKSQHQKVKDDGDCAMCKNIASSERNNEKISDENAIKEGPNEGTASNISDDFRSSICTEVNDCSAITTDRTPNTTSIVQCSDVIANNDVTGPRALPVRTQTKYQCSEETQCTNL